MVRTLKGKGPHKALVVSLKAIGRNKLTLATTVMKKRPDFIIINVEQDFKSVKIYLIKHKVTFTFVYNHSKYSFGIKTQSLEFKTSPTARLHTGNPHYCYIIVDLLIKLK